jgi:hypothetical protein
VGDRFSRSICATHRHGEETIICGLGITAFGFFAHNSNDVVEMKSFSVSVFALLLLGCGLFETNESKKPTFVGEWRYTAQFEYTLGDSLYRDSLDKYMLARGFDLDSFFTMGSSDSGDTETFKRLIGEFTWKCPEGIDCGDRLWLQTRKRRFAADSVFNITYKNGVVSDSFAEPYTYTEDSLLYPITPDFHFGERYEFKPGGDTLILSGILSHYFERDDTLVRLD